MCAVGVFTKVDLFGIGSEAFDESEFSRRIRIEVKTSSYLWMKSPEDSVLRKLLWYQQGGQVSDRQWRDVRGILRVSAEILDREYLKLWARRLGVDPLLSRASASEE